MSVLSLPTWAACWSVTVGSWTAAAAAGSIRLSACPAVTGTAAAPLMTSLSPATYQPLRLKVRVSFLVLLSFQTCSRTRLSSVSVGALVNSSMNPVIGSLITCSSIDHIRKGTSCRDNQILAPQLVFPLQRHVRRRHAGAYAQLHQIGIVHFPGRAARC